MGSRSETQSVQDNPKKTHRRLLLSTTVTTLGLCGWSVTGISFVARWNWIADLLSQLKMQSAIGFFIVLILAVCVRKWGWAVACGIGLIVNVFPFWTYASPLYCSWNSVLVAPDIESTESVSAIKNLRLLSLNVLSSNRQFAEVTRFIEAEDADFVVLLEVNTAWKQNLQPLESTYEFVKYETREGNFGIAFLSKHPWASIEVFESQPRGLPSIDVRFKTLNWEESDRSLERVGHYPLRIIATHPVPPIGESNWNARNEQLFNIARRFDKSTANIMVGDFNLSLGSPFYSDILDAGGLRDGGNGFSLAPSWYVFPTWAGGLRLDHAWVGRGVIPVLHRIGPNVGSDHRPLTMDFRLQELIPLRSTNPTGNSSWIERHGESIR